jgi:hypothetical protein
MSEALLYELQMLFGTAQTLRDEVQGSKVGQRPWPEKMACIEAFAIHARVLEAFLWYDPHKKFREDALAIDYFDGESGKRSVSESNAPNWIRYEIALATRWPTSLTNASGKPRTRDYGSSTSSPASSAMRSDCSFSTSTQIYSAKGSSSIYAALGRRTSTPRPR